MKKIFLSWYLSLKIVFLLFFFAFIVNVNAQQLDSLWNAYNNNTLPDTQRLKAIHAFAWKFSADNPDSAIILALKELELAKLKKQRQYEGTAHNTMGVAYSNKGEFENSLKHYNSAFEIWKQLDKKPKIANALYNIGITYRKMGNYPEALKHYLQALEIHESAGNKKGMGMCYNTIAIIYDTHAEYEKSLEYHNKALVIEEELGDKEGISITYNGMGQVYAHTDKYELAIKYYENAIDLYLEMQNKKGLGNTYNNIGIVYTNIGQIQKALDYHVKSLKIRLETGNVPGQASCYHNIAVAYNELKKYKESVQASEKGLALSKEIGDVESMRLAYENLANVYGKMGNYKLAYENHIYFKQLHDSIFNIENSKQLGDLKTDFEVEKKEVEMKAMARAENEKIKAVNALEKKQQTTVIWFLVAGVLLIAIALTLVINRFRITRQQKKIIEEQKTKVDQAFDQLHEKNQEVLDSIYYARRIQQALITSEKYIDRKLKEMRKRESKS